MKHNIVLTVSIFTGIAATVFALVPVAGAVQNLQRLTSFSQPATQDQVSPIERIKAGEINCRGCDLHGADLSHECVKNGDLTGANFTGATAIEMCMSFANFTDVSFRDANLSGANLSHSNLTHADLTGAKLSITALKGADLSTAKGLTQAQLDRACADTETKLPAGLHAVSCS